MEHQKPYTIRDDVNLPLMSDGPMASPVHKLIAHGVGKVMSSFLCISEKFCSLYSYSGILIFLFGVK